MESMESMESTSAVRKALTLGGGGVTGIAWELGVIVGLHDAGLDVRDADRIVGTSAGSAVGAQIASGVALERLYDAQLVPPEQSSEHPMTFDLEAMETMFQ